MARQAGTERAYYHADGLGSIRNLTNAAGQVINGFGYDAFGASRSGAGTSGNDFRFAGEQLDPETGMYYLRARYYNPALGRFTSPDPIMPGPRNPRALNLYNYAYNNPANLIDPSGKYVLIIGGVGTNYDSETAEDSNWAAMRTALGEAFPNEDIDHFDWSAGGRYDRNWAATLRTTNDAAKDLANYLYWIARKKLGPNEKIRIIGHSKGGALAMEYLMQIAEGTAKQDELVFERLSHVVTLDSPLNGDIRSAGALFIPGFGLSFLPERLKGKPNVQIINLENPNNIVGHGPLPTRDTAHYTYHHVTRRGWGEGHNPLDRELMIDIHGELQGDPGVIEYLIDRFKWLANNDPIAYPKLYR